VGAAAIRPGGEPADDIGVFAGPAFDASDIAAHLAAGRSAGPEILAQRLPCFCAVAGVDFTATHNSPARCFL